MSFSGLQAHPKEFESPYTKILLACFFPKKIPEAENSKELLKVRGMNGG